MAISASVKKTLVMKPEVSQIFNDLEEWLDHCRMNLLDFNPADLYRSKDYKAWAKEKNKKTKYTKKAKTATTVS
jgi:hypothetical protein